MAALLRAAVESRGIANVAFSGGSNAQPMLEALAGEEVPWARTHVYQVDERVAPDAHPDRNAVILQHSLIDKVPIPETNVHLMPVTEPDLEGAAAAYGSAFPRFDVLHMGIGEDGHTASWPPGDPVIEVRHQPVAIVGPFNGRLRMTITPAVVEMAHDLVFLVTGASKRPALERMLAGDPEIPASHVPGEHTVVHADRDAYGG
jgi:6-phosphogluconolactonase